MPTALTSLSSSQESCSSLAGWYVFWLGMHTPRPACTHAGTACTACHCQSLTSAACIDPPIWHAQNVSAAQVLCLLFPLVPKQDPVAAAKALIKDAPEQAPLVASFDDQRTPLRVAPVPIRRLPSLDTKMTEGMQHLATSPMTPGFTNVAPQ